MESAVQSCRKGGVFFIEVNEVGRTGSVEIVPMLLQALNGAKFRELLSGKDERYVVTFSAQGHTVGKGVLSGDPADVHAERFVDPGACDVEILVTQIFHHL